MWPLIEAQMRDGRVFVPHMMPSSQHSIVIKQPLTAQFLIQINNLAAIMISHSSAISLTIAYEFEVFVLFAIFLVQRCRAPVKHFL